MDFLLPSGVGILFFQLITPCSWLHMFANSAQRLSCNDGCLVVLELNITKKTSGVLLLGSTQFHFSLFRPPVHKVFRWQFRKLVLNQQRSRSVVAMFLCLTSVQMISRYAISLSHNSSLFDCGAYTGLRALWNPKVDARLIVAVFGHGTVVPPVVEDAKDVGVSKVMGLDIASKGIILVNPVGSSSRPLLLPGVLLPDNSHVTHSSYAFVNQSARYSRTRLILEPKYKTW